MHRHTDRALIRLHHERHKARVRRMVGEWAQNSYYQGRYGVEDNPRFVGWMAGMRKWCSCGNCRNHRQDEGPTIQDRRAGIGAKHRPGKVSQSILSLDWHWGAVDECWWLEMPWWEYPIYSYW